jgi:hypothetical protein
MREEGEGTSAGGGGGMSDRPVLSGADDRDDVKQLLTILSATVQRERARADQFYSRARNLLAYSTALFTGVQATFITNLGRENSEGVALISSDERIGIAVPALLALITLSAAAVVLFSSSDRARRMYVPSAGEIATAYLAPEGRDRELPALLSMVTQVRRESEALHAANEAREKSNRLLAVLVGTTALLCLGEMVAIYLALT